MSQEDRNFSDNSSLIEPEFQAGNEIDIVEWTAFSYLSSEQQMLVVNFFVLAEKKEVIFRRKHKRNVTEEERREIVLWVESRLPGSKEAMDEFIDLYNTIYFFANRNQNSLTDD